MAKTYYLPKAEKEKAMWLRNLNTKLPGYATPFGFTPAEITVVANDTAAFNYHLDIIELFKTELRERITYKDALKDGALNAPMGPLPAMPTLPAPPPLVAAGLFARVTALVRRIKSHPAYTDSVGQDLGLIGAEPVLDLIAQRPALTLVHDSNSILIKYVRYKNDGIQLFSKRGDEQSFSLLSVVNLPSYRDKRPNLEPGKPELRKYKAWFIVNDEMAGQGSSEEEIMSSVF